MIGYRVVRGRYADLSGEGARLHGGRFNPAGIPAVYVAQSISLEILEVLVHLDRVEVPDDFVTMAVRFSDKGPAHRARANRPALSPPTNFARHSVNVPSFKFHR